MSHKQMPWKDAIVKVLREAGTPLHYRDIAKRIINQKLRTDVGATPSNTVNRILNQEAHKEVFEKVAEGIYRIHGSSYLDNDSNRPILVLGMFWERDMIDWTGNPRILGVEQDGAKPADMADQTGVYLLHDFRGIVYVGRTTDSSLGSRLKAHTKDRLKTRWNRFSWFGFRGVKDDGTLDNVFDKYELRDIISAMEALLIEALEPPQNRRGGDGFKNIEYIQVEDPKKKEVWFIRELTGILQNKNN